jgi:hypothetical protein
VTREKKIGRKKNDDARLEAVVGREDAIGDVGARAAVREAEVDEAGVVGHGRPAPRELGVEGRVEAAVVLADERPVGVVARRRAPPERDVRQRAAALAGRRRPRPGRDVPVEVGVPRRVPGGDLCVCVCVGSSADADGTPAKDERAVGRGRGRRAVDRGEKRPTTRVAATP